MDLPAMRPLPPLDEQEVKATHASLRSKVRIRIIPWLFVLVFLIATHSCTLGSAALTMTGSLGLSDAEYGLGSSIFYAGFIATQLPAVWLARRRGAPLLLGAALFAWACVAALFALLPLVTPAWRAAAFCGLRVALGAAEGGLIPTMYFYLSQWYGRLPDALAGMHGQVTIAAQVAAVAGGLFSAKVLYLLDGARDLEGWQWLFVLEGALVALAALATPLVLARDPESARWLDMCEKRMIAEQKMSTGADGFRRRTIANCDSASAAYSDDKVVQARAAAAEAQARAEGEAQAASAGAMTALVLSDMRVLLLSIVVLLVQVTLWSLLYWQPMLLAERYPDATDHFITLLSAVPHVCGVMSTLLLGKLASSRLLCGRTRGTDKAGDSSIERRWHTAVPMMAGGTALALATIILNEHSGAPFSSFALLCLANGCLWAVGGLLNTWPQEWLHKEAAAVALAVTSSASAVGGLVGPALVGFLTHAQAQPVDCGSGAWEVGSGDAVMCEGASAPEPWMSVHAAVGWLGCCAAAAGLVAACFPSVRRRRVVAPRADGAPTSETAANEEWHPEVSVVTE